MCFATSRVRINNKVVTTTGGNIEIAQVKPEKIELRLSVIYVNFSEKSGRTPDMIWLIGQHITLKRLASMLVIPLNKSLNNINHPPNLASYSHEMTKYHQSIYKTLINSYITNKHYL